MTVHSARLSTDIGYSVYSNEGLYIIAVHKTTEYKSEEYKSEECSLDRANPKICDLLEPYKNIEKNSRMHCE